MSSEIEKIRKYRREKWTEEHTTPETEPSREPVFDASEAAARLVSAECSVLALYLQCVLQEPRAVDDRLLPPVLVPDRLHADRRAHHTSHLQTARTISLWSSINPFDASLLRNNIRKSMYLCLFRFSILVCFFIKVNLVKLVIINKWKEQLARYNFGQKFTWNSIQNAKES